VFCLFAFFQSEACFVQFRIVFDTNLGFLSSSTGVTRELLRGPNPRIDQHRSVVLTQTTSYCGNRTRHEEPGTVSVLLIKTFQSLHKLHLIVEIERDMKNQGL